VDPVASVRRDLYLVQSGSIVVVDTLAGVGILQHDESGAGGRQNIRHELLDLAVVGEHNKAASVKVSDRKLSLPKALPHAIAGSRGPSPSRTSPRATPSSACGRASLLRTSRGFPQSIC